MASRRFYPLEGGARDLPWITLYALTFGAQFLCGTLRGIVFYLPVTAVFELVNHNTGGTQVNIILYLIAYGPLAWSLIALVYPIGAGELWRATSGGRAPSEREREIVERAIADLQARDLRVRGPASWFVLDDPSHNAAVLGNALALNTGAIGDVGFTGTVAHELGHLNSTDGHLTAALMRLETPARLFARVQREGEAVGCLAALFSLVGWIASGAIGWPMVAPLWHAWFRAREFKADEYAARLGLADDLADGLERDALKHDRPTPLRFLSGASHPYTELRIDALRKCAREHTDAIA
jgi:Zn-dependent protease with chaperone function